MHVCRYTHPFATVLDRLPGQYPAWMLEQPQPVPPLPFDSSPFTYVESTAALAEMVDDLSSVREFAVDLEHSDRCRATTPPPTDPTPIASTTDLAVNRVENSGAQSVRPASASQGPQLSALVRASRPSAAAVLHVCIGIATSAIRNC